MWSGYWDEGKTCYDCWWTPYSISEWWSTPVSQWVFMGQCELRKGDAYPLYDPQFWGGHGKVLRQWAAAEGKVLTNPAYIAEEIEEDEEDCGSAMQRAEEDEEEGKADSKEADSKGADKEKDGEEDEEMKKNDEQEIVEC